MGKGGRPKIQAYVNDTLCNHCDWAKDRVNNQHVTGCYCTHYGYIVAQRKERCQGYRPIRERDEDINDGDTTGGGC